MTPTARMLAVAVIAPLVIGAAAVVTMLLALPTLPDPVALHWGPSGEPDRFGSPVAALVVVALAVLAYCAFAFVIIRRTGPNTVSMRVVLAVAPFLATVLGGISAGSLVIQRGLTDAREAPSILPVVGIAFGAALLLAVIAWFVLPADGHRQDRGTVLTLDLGSDERAAWIHTVEPARWLGTLLIVVGAIVIVGGGAAVWIGASTSTLVFYLVTMGVVVVVSVGSLFWTVSIDSRGLIARSILGFPRFTVAVNEVDVASSLPVGAASGYGGWGLRWGGPGRVGIILNSEGTLEVLKKGGASLIITTADSERAAALLNSLARRA